MGLDQAMRETMRLWACGVTVVTTTDGKTRAGMTVSSFTSISLEPPLILVCLHKDAETSRIVTESGIFAVSFLGVDQAHVSSQFAGYVDLPEGADRFYQIDTVTQETGAPILKDAIAWLDCKVYSVQDGGTHWIVLGEVVATERLPDPVWPLVYHNRAYRNVTAVVDPEKP
ncbi:MAG: flavin reductase family protein [Anaerolineae bacterium]|nr:flavin reductase family protein [Anaerolineae bacterium]